MKKLLLVFVLLMVAVSVPTSVPTPIHAQDAAVCNIEAPASSTTINMIGWTYPIIDFYASELEACNGVENIAVNTQLLDSGAAHDQLRLALGAGGTVPYGIIMVTEADVRSYVAEGWMIPLNEYIEKYEEQYNISDIAGLEDLTVDGQVYGIPMELNTRHLFYRPDLLEKYGLEVPQTYDDVIAACEVLKQEESIEVPFTIQLHAGWAWRIEFGDLILAYGGKLLNEDNTPAFNSPEGVQALELILRIAEACMGEDGMTYSIDDSQIGVATGSLAMAVTWASRAAAMDNPEFSDYVGQIEFAPTPRVSEDGPYSATGGTCVHPKSALPAASLSRNNPLPATCPPCLKRSTAALSPRHRPPTPS
jgi:multiple sugar transport system substrate-binding protein